MFRQLSTILVFSFIIIFAVIFVIHIQENAHTKKEDPEMTRIDTNPQKPDTSYSYDTVFDMRGNMIVTEKELIKYH